MNLWTFRNEPMTHYQRVKNRAALIMIALGGACLIGTVLSLFFVGLELVLFLGAAALGFLLVAFQQQVDAIAADDENPHRRG